MSAASELPNTSVQKAQKLYKKGHKQNFFEKMTSSSPVTIFLVGECWEHGFQYRNTKFNWHTVLFGFFLNVAFPRKVVNIPRCNISDKGIENTELNVGYSTGW